MARKRPNWEDLRKIRSFTQLFEYFVDALGWPLDLDALEDDDLEEITFDWDPEELGVSPEQLQSLKRLRQMRPLSDSQPWGIFFVEIAGARLPITQLRRLLRSLVTKRRATGNGARRSWDLDDLLFIVTTDEGDSVELHLLAFFDTGSTTAEIRSLPWRPAGSPARHLQRLGNELLPRLAWPDDETDMETWRESWRGAFSLRHGEAIKSAARLAERMATTAADLRTQIAEAIDEEDGLGPFTQLLDEIRHQLVADVDAKRFADMCAQTLVYGVLSSRVTDPEGFGASPVLSVVPLSNPFLSAFFEQVHDQAVALDMEGSGLEQLIADLRVTNVEAILDQFGSTAMGGDPVIHFYEEFLKQYDSRIRTDAGAFYTPQPVVEFMVRAVDEVLRHRFSLTLGIADSATWSEVSSRIGFAVPEGVDASSRFVSMVEPATGTGTFLVEWLRCARTSFLREQPDGDWPKYLREHVIPSMTGFELMLGPYAIGHLKVALELHGEGVQDVEVRLLLTDTLDHEPPQLRLESMRDPVAIEGEIAASVKRDTRFTVVIGNPPYDREQKEVGEKGKRKGGVVRFGAAGLEPLLESVIEPMRRAGLGVHVKNLYNDYVYFWRWAIWQATELPTGPGVVALITASSYLDGVSMGGLRSVLRDAFEELWIVDLGGEGRGALTEENVFEIRTPVAIAIGIRREKERGSRDCLVRYLRVPGTRADKFARLRTLSLDEVTHEVPGDGLDPFIPRSDADYFSWPQITDLFPWIHSGCQLKRTWPIGESKTVLTSRWKALVHEAPRRRGILLKETRDRTAESSVAYLLSSGRHKRTLKKADLDERPEGIERYGYRSFDRQWVIADNRIADFPRPDLWKGRGDRQVYLTTLTSTKLGKGPVLTITPYVPDLDHFRGSYGAKNVMPLFRDSTRRAPNITTGLLQFLSELLAREVSAEDVFAYVHALLGTPAFAEMFESELSERAGPVRIPITSDSGLFARALEIGGDLAWWHTWAERFREGRADTLPAGSAQELAPVRGYPEKFRYIADESQLEVGTGLFGPVSPEVWAFSVSGLEVIPSWLGYRMAARKGKKSSPLDEIRPPRWTFSNELLELLAIVEHTVEVTPAARALIQDIVAGPLVSVDSLPRPTYADMKPPKD